MLVLLQAAMTAFHCIMQVFTSDHALKLDWIPKWIAIIGSGYIGLEFSDVYTALGSEVTFIEAGPPICCIRQPHCHQADNQPAWQAVLQAVCLLCIVVLAVS